MSHVDVTQGESPLILAMPHSGVYVPPEIEARLNATGRELIATDWHVDRLYEGLADGATTIKALFHRYVIDANRDPTGVSLYPGQNTTELVPATNFNGDEIWATPPTDAEKSERIVFHKSYHDALQAQINRVRAEHGFAILYDCHSIASARPYLFEGKLPDFNIGDNSGRSCAPEISKIVLNACAAAKEFTNVVNGRFKGGWTTRHYGDPKSNVHAIQMELSQAAYLKNETAPYEYDARKAENVRMVFRNMLAQLSVWRPVHRSEPAPGGQNDSI